MPAYIKKNASDILGQALRKITTNTSISSVSPGSVARALTESITTELGDLYDVMDFNLNQNILSTATGSALDLFGSLYNVKRKTLNDLATIDKSLGAFFFYINSPVASDIKIPSGVNVYTDASSYIGRTFSYATESAVTIPAGRTVAYAGLVPNFTDSVFTAGANTLTVHDFTSPPGITVLCNNPKSVSQLTSFEDDDSYRARIIKNIRVTTGGTIEAVRFAALGVSGVRDVSIGQAPYGMGSFEALVVVERTNNPTQVLADATAAMEAVRPLGTRMFTRRPTLLAADMTIDLIMPFAGNNQVSENAIKRASVGVIRYLNSLLPGDPIVYNRLISIILDSSNLIKDVVIKTYSVNGKELIRRNYKPAYDEQITPGNINIGIATA